MEKRYASSENRFDLRQANPLNTYLSTKPSFTSPQPLAAASSLTIPIQITLSQIKLSAFIILVYSNQKGVTLVFRNDPLESLKVSSTFDAIPFVRDYLQREIERQLRTLLMDELPLIIHRLSLRLFNKDYQIKEEGSANEGQDVNAEEKTVDPLASPPSDPVDILGNVLDASQIASLSLDPGSEMHALFSQKNLVCLGALTDSHRTLSLSTPTMRNVVFRAWAGPTERGEIRGSSGKATPAISRSQSYTGSMSTKYIFSESPTDSFHPSRPTLSSFGSAMGLNSSLARHTKPHGRKKKHRVVNLRKKAIKGDDENESFSEDSTTNSVSGTESISSAPSEYPARPCTPEEKEPGDVDVGFTPPRLRDVTPRPDVMIDDTPRQSQYLPRHSESKGEMKAKRPIRQRPGKSHELKPLHTPFETGPASPPFSKNASLRQLEPSPFIESPSSNTNLGNAWMNKIADEILRKVQDQKAGDSRFWDRTDRHDDPPPAYGA